MHGKITLKRSNDKLPTILPVRDTIEVVNLNVTWPRWE